MIKCISLVIAAALLVSVAQQARADSLVCNHNGQQLIYTEVKESDDPNGVKSVYASGAVIFHNEKEYRYNGIIPCVMIKEERGETKFLQEYLSQFE